MPIEEKGDGAFNTGPLDAGPEQGGSNMGGLGATGAMDRERDPEAEGYTRPKTTSARDAALAENEEGEKTDRVSADGGS